MRNFLRRLWFEEKGQGLLFGVVSIFILCLSTAMVYNLGEVTSTKMKVQVAADSAATAGALIEADIASAMAWMNDGMAYLYYHMMRYAVDLTVYGTLREFKHHHEGFQGDPILAFPQITDEQLGVTDVEAKFDRAYDLAEHWIPKGEDWLERISSIEEGILIAGPIMMKQEIFRVAREAGAEYVTIWPDIELWNGTDDELTILIEKLGSGWRLTASNGYMCEVIKTGPEAWQITVNTGLVVNLGKVDDDPLTYEISTSNGTQLRATKLPGIGWAVTGTAGGKSVSFTPTPAYGEGSYRITSGGSSAVVRPGAGGTEMLKNGSWVPLENQDSINVGGTEIPINHTGAIKAGEADIYLPGSLGNPHARVELNDTEIVLKEDDVDLYAHIGMAEVRIEENEVVVNRLSNLYHADGKWRTWIHKGRRHATGGLWRHRMTEETSTIWTYEYRKQGPHFTTEPEYKRFGYIHAILDNESFDPVNPVPEEIWPSWTKWFSPEQGRAPHADSREPGDETTYHQTRTCWHPKDLWCPKHGLHCPGNPTRPCGYWHEDDEFGNEQTIPCPCCNRNDGPHGYYHQLGTDYDGDGKTDVRFFQYDSRDHPLRRRTNPLINDPSQDPPWDLQAIRLRQVARPKVLTEYFFAFQTNVGCYIGPQDDDPAQLLFEDPPWGYFAVASARPAFLDAGFEIPGFENALVFRRTFETIEEREDWLEYSSANLYEPNWLARLSSSRRTIKPEDLDVLPGVEMPVNWIYKGMAWEANWRTEYNGLPDPSVNKRLRDMFRPESVDDFFDPVHLVGTREDPFRGSRFDLSDIGLEDVVKH